MEAEVPPELEAPPAAEEAVVPTSRWDEIGASVLKRALHDVDVIDDA